MQTAQQFGQLNVSKADRNRVPGLTCVHEQVAKRIVNVRFTKKEHLLRETSQKSRLHSPAQITQKKQDDVIKL